MQAILGSKIYKTSSRKDEILAKLSDPINTELVTQLREYLDDEYLTPKYFPELHKDTEPSPDESSESTKDSFSEKSTPHLGPAGGRPVGQVDLDGLDDDLNDSNEIDIDEEMTDSESDSSEETDEEPAEEVQESVAITSVDEPVATEDMSTIQDKLNSQADTKGVIRTKQRNNEFWIFYDDSINLNSVMSKVIDILSSPEYSYLDFNRLARTDNAIVFEIIDR